MPTNFYGPSKYSSCKFWSCSFAATVFLLFVSAITVIVCGAVIAGPGIRALKFEETTCTTLSQKFLQIRSCKCEGFQNRPDCSSRFPCIRVTVEYDSLRHNNHSSDGRIEAYLNEHESTVSSEFSECSVYSCKQERKANDYAIESFSLKYGGRGKNFTCFYDKHHPSVAITKRNYSRVDIIIALALPGGIFLILCLALTLMCVAKCHSKENPVPMPRVIRGYMNPTVLRDNHEPMLSSELPLPSCCTSLTYMRQEDPLPPRKIVSRTL